MKDLTLVEINNIGNGFFLTDKGTIHNYLPIYEKLFEPFRHKEINFFEVGYQHGGSCKLWEKYFSKAIIKSIDIDNTCPPPPVGGRIIFEVQDIRTLPKEYFKYFPIDIAIDDGSHNIFYQIHCINAVYPALNSGGLLIIEDVMDFENNKISFDELKIPYEIIDKRNEQLVADELLLIFKK